MTYEKYTGTPAEVEYGMTAMEDLARVRAGQKPLVIVSMGKCEPAFFAAVDIAHDDENLTYETRTLVCEDGREWLHVFICIKGAPYAAEALDAIHDCKFGAITREDLQMRLGLLLGHSAAECLEFTASEIGRTCVCDCCGGKASAWPKGWSVVEHAIEDFEHITLDSIDSGAYTDSNPGRFTRTAYRY
jgi:hypothetical protein